MPLTRRQFLRDGALFLGGAAITSILEGEPVVASEVPIISARLIGENLLLDLPGTYLRTRVIHDQELQKVNKNNRLAIGVSLLGEVDKLGSASVHQSQAKYIDKSGSVVASAIMAIPQIEFGRFHRGATIFNPEAGVVKKTDKNTGLAVEYSPIYFSAAEMNGNQPLIAGDLMGNLALVLIDEQKVISAVRPFPWLPMPEGVVDIALAVNSDQQTLLGNPPYDGRIYGYNDKGEIVYRSEQPVINLQ